MKWTVLLPPPAPPQAMRHASSHHVYTQVPNAPRSPHVSPHIYDITHILMHPNHASKPCIKLPFGAAAAVA